MAAWAAAVARKEAASQVSAEGEWGMSGEPRRVGVFEGMASLWSELMKLVEWEMR